MKWQTVMWHCEFEQSIHIQQPRGLDLGGKVLALALPRLRLSRPRPRPRPEVSRPRPEVSRPRPRPCAMTLSSKPMPRPSWGVLEDPRGQGQASRTTRLPLFDCSRLYSLATQLTSEVEQITCTNTSLEECLSFFSFLDLYLQLPFSVWR